jgi:hypothetical protein
LFKAAVICLPSQAHPDYSYHVGDIVLNLARTLGQPPGLADPDGGSPAGSSPRLASLDGSIPLEAVVGEVLRAQEGRILVHWVDGSESAVLPDQARTAACAPACMHSVWRRSLCAVHGTLRGLSSCLLLPASGPSMPWVKVRDGNPQGFCCH